MCDKCEQTHRPNKVQERRVKVSDSVGVNTQYWLKKPAYDIYMYCAVLSAETE
jgi:hypothetical protein